MQEVEINCCRVFSQSVPTYEYCHKKNNQLIFVKNDNKAHLLTLSILSMSIVHIKGIDNLFRCSLGPAGGDF